MGKFIRQLARIYDYINKEEGYEKIFPHAIVPYSSGSRSPLNPNEGIFCLLILGLNNTHANVGILITEPVVVLDLIKAWTREILLDEAPETQQEILSEWNNDEEKSISQQFKCNIQKELIARLIREFGDALTPSARIHCIEEFFKKQDRPHVFEMLVKFSERINELYRGMGQSESQAYRDAVDKISLLGNALYAPRKEEQFQYDDDFYLFPSKHHIDLLVKLHKVESFCREALKTKSGAAVKIFEKFKHYIELSYKKLAKLENSCSVCDEFVIILENHRSEKPNQSLSIVDQKIRERLLSEDDIPKIVRDIQILRKISEIVSKRNEDYMFFKRDLVGQVKTEFENCLMKYKEDEYYEPCRTILDLCTKIQNFYKQVCSWVVEESVDKKLFLDVRSLEFWRTVNNEKSLAEKVDVLQETNWEFPTGDYNCIIRMADVFPSEKLRNMMLAILENPAISIDDKKIELQIVRDFSETVLMKPHQEESHLFMSDYFLWRISQFSYENLKSSVLIHELIVEKDELLIILNSEIGVDNPRAFKAIKVMQIYSDNNSCRQKQAVARRSIFSAKMYSSPDSNQYFKKFAENEFLKAKPVVERHQDPDLVRFFYELAESAGTFLVLPIYRLYKYGNLFPTKGEMMLYDLKESLQCDALKNSP